MKNTNSIKFLALLLVGFLFGSCDKDLMVDIKNVEINNLDVETKTTSAMITGAYTFPSVLKSIDLLLDENPEMDDAEVYSVRIDSHKSLEVGIDSLRGATTYYFCFEYFNGMDKALSEVRSFTTKDYRIPQVETLAVPDEYLTATTAKVGGKVLDDGDLAILEQGVYWSLSPNPSVNDNHMEGDLGPDSFSCLLEELQMGTKYYVMAYARNNKGIGFGNVVSFETMDGLIDVVTYWPIDSVQVHSMVCRGKVRNDGGSQVVEKGICYGLSENPTYESQSHVADGAGVGSISVKISNLYADTTYYVRAYAINSEGGRFYGEVLSQRTLSGKPTVVTDDPDMIKIDSARCLGEIISDGGLPVIERGICYSTGENPTYNNHPTPEGHGGTGNFSVWLPGLRRNQKYYYRAYAKNVEGIVGLGSIKSFETKDGIPDVRVLGINKDNTDISKATCVYAVYSGHGSQVLEHGICWSSSTSTPTLDDNEGHNAEGSGTSSSSFSSVMLGLSPSTTYHVRAYATNIYDTYYTEPLSFETYTGEANVSNFRVVMINSSSALCRAYIEAEPGLEINDFGICYSVNPNPQYDANSQSGYNSNGYLYKRINSLTAETVYYIRLYVKYGDGRISYFPDEDVSFKTTKEGGLTGEFSIGEGKKICFSKSNLIYKGHWTFSDNQWDYLGNNGQGSENQNAERDLFGWGTSNKNHGAVCYQPWSTIKEDAKYWVYGYNNTNLYDRDGTADWGYNAINHGGNTEHLGWRVMKKSEWSYLLLSRQGAAQKYSIGTVNNVHGLILLPDTWTLPAGLSFVPRATDWSTNNYNQDQWEIMESAGAAFLPAAGRRDGTEVGKCGTHGYYWASSLVNESKAYTILFSFDGVDTQYPSQRCIGRSVRLVMDL